ncbi:aldehyde reductase [Plesiocystis pacifica SIR-1]|uniref:Aldehyde reductase n=1 Tax=Plesiocystis pacifica SIR-1 TaxID=391625 RepID=A6GFB3_9BACT|nr:aldo/keto reductase [Plesiocystis pacifica]EDM75454.1 aldehyde reductase [Plesiocystis pacifica SIR-1]
MKHLTLANGDRMPALGLGTWKSSPGEVGAAVETAIELGYRHIDCAAIYGNEAEIGEAIARCVAKGTVTRDQLWITSKLWNDCHAPEHVGPALDATLERLGLEHLDLYLIHWPVAHVHGAVLPKQTSDFVSLDDLPISATWAALEACVDAGKTRHIGVSNFSAAKLASVCEGARVQPACNQVELHPYLQQRALVDACAQRGVLVTAYSPLGSRDRAASFKAADEPVLLEDPSIAAIAERLGCSPAQVLIAWAIDRGTSVIPKSVNPQRLAQNLASASIELDADARQLILTLDRERRYIDGTFWTPPGSPYSLATLWDE